MLQTSEELPREAYPSRTPARRLFGDRDIRRAAVLALMAFVVYNANLRSVTSLDTYPTRLLPISIIREGNLDLDEFGFLQKYPDWHQARGVGATLPHPYYVNYTRGHVISHYPVMPAILAVPVYVVPVLLGLTDGSPSKGGFSRAEIVGTMLSKFSGAAAVALSVGIVYLMLLRVTTRGGALWIALVYAFSTSSWSVSSQGLWQSSMSEPLLALTLYFLVRARDEPQYAAWAGLPLALSVACRPPIAVAAVVFLVYVYRHHRTRLLGFLIAPMAVAAFLTWYNFYYFGSLVGGYANSGGVEQFTWPRLEWLLALLVSPSRGILVLSPVLIFAAVAMAASAVRGRDPLLHHVAIATVLLLLLFSMWSDWHGAFAYSYRFLVDVLPGMALALGAAWSWINANRLRRGSFMAAAAFSVVVQIVGAFNFPCGWQDEPVSIREKPERFWDWKDSEFARCLSKGPVVPDGIRALQEWRGGRPLLRPGSR